MKKIALLFLIIIISVVITSSVSLKSQVQTKTVPEIQYLSPLPGSKYISKETNIIIRFENDINFAILSTNDFIIEGTASGIHSCRIIKTDDKNVLILKQDYPFTENENVRVSIPGKMFTKRKTSYEFNFQISDVRLTKDNIPRVPYSNYSNIITNNYYKAPSNVINTTSTDSLPQGFPQIKVTRKYTTGPGYLFLSNFPFGPMPNTPYLMILNDLGSPVLYKRMTFPCFDFKVQNNNVFTYFDGLKMYFVSTDFSFNVLDSFYCGNGYSTDVHELLLLPNNHAYMMSYDSQYVDMSQIVQGGDTNAVVSGLIIQEIDENKNVVFQWRSWDHFQITDATHINLLAKSIDYVHGNAIDLDFDGHVLISSRHMDEITKINRQTGEIIWRLGGKNNQFNFINDPIKFSYQHCIRKLANGNYLLYDNGNYHNPPFSRACEYKLDEVNKTATLVWQFRNSPDVYGMAMGSAQRLENGNTVIGWGSAHPTISEARPNGIKNYEMYLPAGIYTYRAFRHTWEGMPADVMPQSFSLYQNFPNPFNPSTTIKYSLTQNNYVTLKVYDAVGREVKTLISENQTAGTYIVDFKAENLSSGVYFYKLVAGGSTEAKKMILIK